MGEILLICGFLAGDVRDATRLRYAMADVDIVIHAAAMKHVDVVEYNPFEAVKTNVLGTQHVIEAAIDACVDRVLLTSSDKAVDPANTMGTTKLLAEKLVTAANEYAGAHAPRFASVRFGNVLHSSRSVLPVFTAQLRAGGPLTVTDPAMTRFFLQPSELVELVMAALGRMRGGEVFIRRMPAIAIGELAEALRLELAPQLGVDPDAVAVEVVGPRPGETQHEQIMSAREADRAVAEGALLAILPEATDQRTPEPPAGFAPTDSVVRSSAAAEPLGLEEIRAAIAAEAPVVVDG